MQTTLDGTHEKPEPSQIAKAVSAVVVILVAVVVWRIVDIRNTPPPPPAENYKLMPHA